MGRDAVPAGVARNHTPGRPPGSLSGVLRPRVGPAPVERESGNAAWRAARRSCGGFDVPMVVAAASDRNVKSKSHTRTIKLAGVPLIPTFVTGDTARKYERRNRDTSPHPPMRQPGAILRAPGVINPAGLAQNQAMRPVARHPPRFRGREKRQITGGPPRPHKNRGKRSVAFLTI